MTAPQPEPDWARPVVHWEIEAREPEKASAFYSQLFNWKVGDGRVRPIEPGVGAPETITGHIFPGERSGVVLYIQVRDLTETLARVPTLGGAVLRAPFDIPGGPTVAGIADPEGNRVMLVQQ